MRTDEELEVLFAKFERDMDKRTWFMRLLLVTDQFFNVLLWNGSQDETISSHVGRRVASGEATWFDKLLCKFLGMLEDEHCKKSLGE